MTSKLIPQDPSSVMVIRKVTPNIITCSAPFARFGRFKVGGRGTIANKISFPPPTVRLQSGRLAVFSPTALTPEVRSTVDSLGGNVAYLTALDYEHHIFLTEWARAFPSAKLLGVEGLPEKRAKSHEPAGTKFAYVWTMKNKREMRVEDDEFNDEFDVEYVGSHGNKELVFCHRPDRTLIQADLLFNLPATEQYSRSPESATSGLLTRLFTRLFSAQPSSVAQKRFLWYVASARDRVGFNASMKRIDSWDFDRIVPCHGDVIERDGKGVFREVMEWHLKATGGS
ncbi:MAG: hypothetical protein Q9187_006230 [Circinaria calcarea]